MAVVFYAICVLVHLALALTLGSSIIFFLLDGMDFMTAWPTHLAQLWEGLWNQRRRYFAVCVLGNVLLLPLVVGLLDARMLRLGKRIHGIVLISGAAFLLFALAMFTALALKPFSFSHVGMMTFFLLIVLVGVWNAAYIPLSVAAHIANARICRFLFRHNPGVEP